MPVWLEALAANTVERVMSKNPNRLSLTVKNDSAADVYYGHNITVATSGHHQGFKILASGGVLTDEYHKGDVYLITGTACNVTLVEDVKELEEKKTEVE